MCIRDRIVGGLHQGVVQFYDNRVDGQDHEGQVVIYLSLIHIWVTKYMQKEEKDALKKDIKPGMWLKVQGYIKLNRDGSDIVLDPRNISTYPHEMRKDTARCV